MKILTTLHEIATVFLHLLEAERRSLKRAVTTWDGRLHLSGCLHFGPGFGRLFPVEDIPVPSRADVPCGCFTHRVTSGFRTRVDFRGHHKTAYR
jgi:hypothetical protein